MRIREEDFTLDFFKECGEDFINHLREVQVIDKEPVVDYIAYIRASMRKDIVVFVAREEGKMVGYLAYWIVPDVNHEQFVAQQAAVYLNESHRQGFNAVKMIKYAERVLKRSYQVETVVHISTVKKDISPLFKYLNYKEAETLYIKEI